MVPGLNLVPALLTEHEHQCMYVKNLLTGPEPVIDRRLRRVAGPGNHTGGRPRDRHDAARSR